MRSVRVRLRILSIPALATSLVLAGCAGYSTESSRSESTVTCDEVLGSVINRVRVDDTSGVINDEIQWLSDNCSTQFDIATDYFSARGSLTGPYADGDCTVLVDRIRAEAIRLVAEDGLCTSDPSAAIPDSPAQPGAGIAWDDAASYAGTVQRVCGPLVGDGVSDDDVFLNLGLDYPDPGRFQIVIWDVGALEPIAYGSTLCTSGLISLYHGVAQIEIEDPARVEIYY